jgi:Skp family chaperone for outer membrane proteins
MKKLSLIIIIACIAHGFAKAQVAVVNSQKILVSIPQIAKSDTLVAKETAIYAAEYNKIQIAVNQLAQVADSLYKLDPKSAATTNAITAAQNKGKELKAYADESNKKLASYKELLQKPYIDKIYAAIKTVAQLRKFMQVVDQSNNLLYVNPATDITNEVIKTLKAN